MRRYEKKQVTKEENTMVEQTCDLCGKKAVSPDWRWFGDYYDVSETEVSVTVKLREGTSYPEGGCGTKYEIDICPKCFKGRLVPWLRSQGADIKETTWDW